MTNAEGEITGKVALALISLYLIWGSTYLAIRIGLEGFPPFMMARVRFTIAGAALYAFLRMRGVPPPVRPEWLGASAVGALLILGGNGGVVYAEQTVSSGLAALGVASTPLWTVIFSSIWKHRPTRLEWAGLAVGMTGVALLNLKGDLRASAAGALALLIAAVSWSFGSAWSRHLRLPGGLMGTAAEMLAGGIILLAVSIAAGEKMAAAPSLRSASAVLYLIVFGSLMGFTAYMYLLGNVRPALATSYAYVNPIIAIVLGLWLAGERITPVGIFAMAIILTGVALVVMGRKGNGRG